MRKFLVILMFVSLLSAAACSSVEQHVVSTLLDNYVSAQEALASDNLAAAVQAFGAMAPDSDGALEKMVLEISEAEDLESVRSRFKQLSEKIREMDLPEGYVAVHCPMADDGEGADWVQKEGDIANPYFGTAMKECGEIIETSE